MPEHDNFFQISEISVFTKRFNYFTDSDQRSKEIFIFHSSADFFTFIERTSILGLILAINAFYFYTENV